MKLWQVLLLCGVTQSASAQEIRTADMPTSTDLTLLLNKTPDYGYVVYDADGKAIKAFGPDTPITTEAGNISIVGGDIPAGAIVKTEDGPAYLNALFNISAKSSEEVKSDLSKQLNDLAVSIGEGTRSLKDSLCANPAHPSTVKVEIEGGFSFGVYGSIKSTVDWDLEKVCVATADTNSP
jgi:hypothetical protein